MTAKFKFKKISKHDPLYIGDGFISNRHWLFKSDWVETLKTRASLQLRNHLQALRIKTVTEKFSGNESPTYPLGNLVSGIDLANYRPIQLNSESVRVHIGFRKNEMIKSPVAFVLQSGKTKVGIDPEYMQAFYFDSEIEILINGPRDPIVMRKNNEVIGLIGPMQLKGEY